VRNIFYKEKELFLLSDAPLLGKLLAFTTNITLAWKGLSGTNTLAYCEN
jgi:hypothetical protein